MSTQLAGARPRVCHMQENASLSKHHFRIQSRARNRRGAVFSSALVVDVPAQCVISNAIFDAWLQCHQCRPQEQPDFQCRGGLSQLRARKLSKLDFRQILELLVSD